VAQHLMPWSNRGTKNKHKNALHLARLHHHHHHHQGCEPDGSAHLEQQQRSSRMRKSSLLPPDTQMAHQRRLCCSRLKQGLYARCFNPRNAKCTAIAPHGRPQAAASLFSWPDVHMPTQ
jgi:hypothetical protein